MRSKNQMLHKSDHSKRMDLYALPFLVLGKLGLLFSIFYVYRTVHILFPPGCPICLCILCRFTPFFIPFPNLSVVASTLASLAYVDRRRNRLALLGYSMIAAGFITPPFWWLPHADILCCHGVLTGAVTGMAAEGPKRTILLMNSYENSIISGI